MPTKIQVKNITKIFGKNPKSIVQKIKQGMSKNEILEKTGHTVGIYNANFEVKEGEIFVIMGLSGSGKSTLIRCLNLLNKPTAGQIFVDGEEVTSYNKKQLQEFRKTKIAMVFQHFGLFTHRSVLENVAYGLEIKGVPKEEREKIALKNIQIVGLEGYEQQMPDQLSGGMQQRVGLARALANDPDILLMDEPFSALDPLIRREMHVELLDLQAKLKKTIIFITHDINEAFKLGDRVAVMKDGQIVQTGTPEEILESPADEYIEDFVKDIDRSKVLQAKHIMMSPDPVAYMKDGLKLVVKKMEQQGISSLYVVDTNRKLQGIVTIDDAIEARQRGQELKDIIKHDFEKTNPETFIQDLIPQATQTKYPIAVIDQEQKLLGLIVRVSVLSGLV
ncbi:glycine betaine/L-proline ABC transporter ATP-binding protein [Bacillus aquiflavi]|uniref:Quaternary amine transport ATP-binding protein n=1 Tax=Bacillus aquiflavi TaxID=2672567 RepID=A0A6B3VXY9_9BACI|nr:glycine betaine/L-proline ABC transporter ATP-binding protein [Bacillus aquiflavi]MBA4536057.1 glycine betaine/L-proline ABC transporter ATP-binding protein [Bacillus aquiflavi]NEY80431.1 glycine betaine/L-proline ABC transporter ATP-binding protein [Bacillus aquiflavi]